MTTTNIDERARRGLAPGSHLTRTINGVPLERMNWGTFRHPDGTLYVYDVETDVWIMAHPCRRGMLAEVVEPGA